MPLIAFLYELLYHWFKLGQYVDGNLWFLFHEYLKRIGSVLMSVREDFIEQEGVVSVQREDHLPTLLIRATLCEDVLDNFAGECMQHKFVHLRANQLTEGLFLLVKRGEVIEF